MALLKAIPSPELLEGQTAANWLRRWMGTEAYNQVWRPQLVGKLVFLQELVSDLLQESLGLLHLFQLLVRHGVSSTA